MIWRDRVARRGTMHRRRGRLMATALGGAWRRDPRPLDMSPATLSEVVPLLLQSGAGPLVWWRSRRSPLGTSRAVETLHQAYRLAALRAPRHRYEIAEAVSQLRAEGVEPVLVKGWAIGRLYPYADLRPVGDIDLCVRHADLGKARHALAVELAPIVDLHDGFRALGEADEREMFQRSVLVECAGVPVRVLAPEDHLRVLCCHLLRHGAARALSLCDVALALEERPADFDWARCLGRDRRIRNWVTVAIALAHHLLGARVEGTPFDGGDDRLPSWLVATVLRQWGRGAQVVRPLADRLRRPARLVAELPDHWPNGIQATVALRRPFGAWPRLTFQIGASLLAAGRVARSAHRQWRASRPHDTHP